MQTLLQDVIGHLTLVRAISPSEERLALTLWDELRPFAHSLWGCLLVTWTWVLMGRAIAKDYITSAEFIPSVMILASSMVMLLSRGKGEKGTVIFRLKAREARWKGPLALSVLLSGVVLLAIVEWKKT